MFTNKQQFDDRTGRYERGTNKNVLSKINLFELRNLCKKGLFILLQQIYAYCRCLYLKTRKPWESIFLPGQKT